MTKPLWRRGLKAILSKLRFRLPPGLMRHWVNYGYIPPQGTIDMGQLRSLTPLSRSFGFDRGQPIDRYYIEQFLATHAADVRGRVLEVGGRDYTLKFGAAGVTHCDVLNVRATDPHTTIAADITHGQGIPDAAFDCIILTQTLHLIFELPSAIATLNRILKPGGTLLLTVPGTISQLEEGTWRSVWYWGFTRLSLEQLFRAAFPAHSMTVYEFGNVLTSVAFLEGLVAEELTAEELSYRDELYPLLLALRVRKPS
jgi:SAM-dependent methyltransferase